MASLNRKICASNSAVFDFTSIIIAVLIGCTAAAIEQRPLNAVVELDGHTSFVCSSDIGVPQWMYSSDGKGNTKSDVKSDHCSVYPEDVLHFETQSSNTTCTLNVRNATKKLAGVYTCIDGSSKSDRFSALLTIIDSHPTVLVNNQSTVYEGQKLNITCRTSYAGPLAPAPPLAPSIYFLTTDDQRVSDIGVSVTSDEVQASFSIAATLPIVPSFTCIVFFPNAKETKQLFASNTPNITYRGSSPVFNVSKDSESRTDASLRMTTDCKSDSCGGENRRNVNASTDDVGNSDWRSIDEATGGDNNGSAEEATTTLHPIDVSVTQSWNVTDDYKYIADDDSRTINSSNETSPINVTEADDDTHMYIAAVGDGDNGTSASADEAGPSTYYETYLPKFNDTISGTEASYNFTEIDEGRKNDSSDAATYYQYDHSIWNDTTDIASDDAADYPYFETTSYNETELSDWKDTLKGTESLHNSTNTIDNDENMAKDDFSKATTYYQMDQPDQSENDSNSTDDTVDDDDESPTNATDDATDDAIIPDETDFPKFNQTKSGTHLSDNSTDIYDDSDRTPNDTDLFDQEANTTNLTTDLTNLTEGDARSLKHNISNKNYSIDRFLNSTFPFNVLNEIFPNFYRNEAAHLSKASFTSLVISALILLLV